MHLRQLEQFLAVIETGSLTAAAERVNLTQQALSKSLSRLEDSIGGKLFHRETRGMTVTRLGETVAEHAREVVASAGRLRIAAAAESGLERGKLVIGLSPIAATTHVGVEVIRFAESNPDLRIDVEAGIDLDFAAALNRGQLDIAISSQMHGTHANILTEIIGAEAWGVVGRTGHPLLEKARSLADLEGANWVLGRNTNSLDEDIETAFITAGARRPQPGIMTSSVLFALTMLAQSGYLSILPRSLCVSMPSLIWRDLSKGMWSTPIFLMRRNRAYLSHAATQLLEALDRSQA
jgi:DNA-binding transcriptional LysR family regulator